MPDLLPNWDFVGRCYDVLQVDPLRIEAGSKFPMVFSFPAGADGYDAIADGSKLKPKCTKHMPSTGGSLVSSTTSMSSTYDFQQFNKLAGTVKVSDPTGGVFSCTLSASFSETRNEITSSSKVVTYSQQQINRYALSMDLNRADLRISSDLAERVARLPAVTDAEAYRQFIEHFGTHYAFSATFGGRAYQRLTVEQSDYTRLLDQGVNVEAEASLTFELAKGCAKGSREDKRTQKFVNATKSTTSNIVYAGGTPGEQFTSWAPTVATLPTPIQIDLQPLYSLLYPRFFPDEGSAIHKKRALLEDAIDNYIRSNGEDVRRGVLQYGDEVLVSAVGASGEDRYLSAANPGYVLTARASTARSPGSNSALRWSIVHADDPKRTGDVKKDDIIALRSAQGGLHLDAQAGTDQVYARGDGLTAATSRDTHRPEAQWRVVLAGNRARNEMVDGDYVRFASQWQDSDGNRGYLMSEDWRDAAQRVYAFGKASAGGTLWRISRVP